MKNFLKKIVTAIVEEPDKVEISEVKENDQAAYTILVPENEIGRVIGKEGRVITAIRCLARLKALKKQEKILIKVEAKT